MIRIREPTIHERVCDSRHPVFKQSFGGLFPSYAISAHLPAGIFCCMPVRENKNAVKYFFLFEAKYWKALSARHYFYLALKRDQVYICSLNIRRLFEIWFLDHFILVARMLETCNKLYASIYKIITCHCKINNKLLNRERRAKKKEEMCVYYGNPLARVLGLPSHLVSRASAFS